jgi:hypothetical protein
MAVFLVNATLTRPVQYLVVADNEQEALEKLDHDLEWMAQRTTPYACEDMVDDFEIAENGKLDEKEAMQLAHEWMIEKDAWQANDIADKVMKDRITHPLMKM